MGVGVELAPGAFRIAVDMPEPKARWLITCSCGWTSEFSQRWHAESVAKLHPKLGEANVAHTVTIEGPPADPRPGDQLTLT